MFIFQIKEYFLQKGLKPSVSTLMKMGIAQKSAYNYLSGKAMSIRPDHLYKMCTYLNCTPKELLRLDLPEDDPSLENHPLKEWAKRPTAFPLHELQDLTPAQLEAAHVAIRKIIKGE